MKIFNAWRSQSAARHQFALLLAVSALCWQSPSIAQTASVETDTRPWVKPNDQVKALSGDVFGDAVNLSTGTLTFSHSDVSLPGNSNFPVAVTRNFSTNADELPNGLFGDWDLDLPRMEATFADPTGAGAQGKNLWVVASGIGMNQPATARCTQYGLPPSIMSQGNNATLFSDPDYFSGVQLHLPGEGGGEVLKNNSPNGWRQSEFELVTNGRALISCLAQLHPGLNSASEKGGEREDGEGFEVHTPDGLVYRFDWMVYRPIEDLTKPEDARFVTPPEGGDALLLPGHQSRQSDPGLATMPRVKGMLFPTRVTDRFGHWVDYQWNPNAPAQLKKILADDGRTITFEYAPTTNRISRITATSSTLVGGRSWNYGYLSSPGTASDGSLTSVRLPDTTEWTFGLSALFNAKGRYTEAPLCGFSGSADSLPESVRPTGWVRHPSGAKATFTLDAVLQTRTHLPWCNEIHQAEAQTPPSAVFMSIREKRVEGAGLPFTNWEYAYDLPPSCWLPGDGGETHSVPCTATSRGHKTVMLTQTEGDATTAVTEYRFGTRVKDNDGKLLRIRQGNGGSPMSIREFIYAEPSHPQFPNPIGAVLSSRIDEKAVNTLSLQQRKQEVRDGATYVNEEFDYDKYGYPTKIVRSNSTGPSKTEVIEYQHFDGAWVLGQTRRVRDHSTAGTIEREFVYDTTLLKPTHRYVFGRLDATLTYYTPSSNPGAAGLLATVKDGGNKVTRLNNYHRGLPRQIVFHDGSSQSATINDYGEITSMTDELGYTTSYQYDNLGRLSKITHPTSDSTAWTSTDITFAPYTGTDHFGLGAGHWKQSITTGDLRKEIHFDALWRPVLTHEWDNATNRPRGDRFVLRRFDADGRETFASYPRSTVGSVNDTVSGVTQSYDALGRLEQTQADSESVTPGVSGNIVLDTKVSYTENPGFKTIRNPRYKRTKIKYLQYDAPTEDLPIEIVSLDEPVTTSINRDRWGKPNTITRSRVGGGESATRSFHYDDHQRLYKTVEPERGAEFFHYDSANRIDWSATVASSSTMPDCGNASFPDIRCVLRTYDARDRLTGVNYSDSTYDETRTYFADGALQSAVRGPGQPNEVKWEYQYNKRRLPTEARIHIGGESSAMNWTYNGRGQTSAVRQLNGFWLDYAPNAWGQPTQVYSPSRFLTYASGISYYPNGALKQFTYGNNVVHQLAQTVRQMPGRSWDVKGSTTIVDNSYVYDEIGNPTVIDDALNIDDKTLIYDALDRLTSATGSFGAASMSYDALDNLKSHQVGTRNWIYQIDANTQRVTSVNDASTGALQVEFQYDDHGNVSRRTQGTFDRRFNYDRANRLSSVTTPAGSKVAEYVYDALGRRTRTQTPVSGISNKNLRFQIYTPGGEFQWENAITWNYNGTGGASTQINYISLGGTLIAKQLGKSTFTTDTGARMADGTLGFNPFANPYEGATPGQADGEHGNASGNGNGNGGGNGNGNPGGNGNGGGNPDPNAVATTAVVSPETYSVEYVHTDALGSPVAYTNSSGNVLPDRRTQYEPYGTPTTTPREGEPSYTGHQYDTSTGLIYAQHRYYDPALGRFLGVDPMAVDTSSAFNWNRYAYAANSPYKFTDPDGRVVVVPAIYAVVEAIAWASAAYVVTDIAVDSVRDSGLTVQDVGMGSLLLMNPTLAGSMNEATTPEGQTGNGIGAITSDRPAGTDGKRGSTGGPGAGKRFSPETPEVKADKEGVPCAYCGVPTTNEPGKPNSRERDHVDPKSRGGNNTSENERDSCRTCNRQKGPRNPDEWQPTE